MRAALAALSLALLAPGAFGATVGALPTAKNVANVFGLDDVCAPQLGTSYPDFVFCAGSGSGAWPYIVFGGSYNQLAWADWQNSVKHYIVQVDDYSMWTGVWVAGRGDLNGDDNNDVLIGDPRHLNFPNNGEDWANNIGICYALYNVGEPASVGESTLDLDDPGTMATVARITADQVQSRFGCCSEIIGDVDDDGYADILVGESGWGPTSGSAQRERYECGRACLFFGSANFSDTGTTSASVVLLTGEDRNDHFGAAVSSAGFLDDSPMAMDRYGDFAIGAPWYDKSSGQTVTENAGRVYVFYGTDAAISSTHATDANVIITGETTDSFFGSAISCGDFDGDNYDDLVVGACGYDNQTGRAYVFFSSSLRADADGYVDAADADVKIDGSADGNLFGNAVSTAGTFFGQLVATDAVIVGAPGVEDTKGAFYVFDMRSASSSMSASDADYISTGSTVGMRVGLSVTDLADVDGDMDSDVAVLASGVSNGTLAIHDKN